MLDVGHRRALLGEGLLLDLHCQWLAEAAGHVEEQDDPDREPDKAVPEGLEVQVYPEHGREAHSDERQHDVSEDLLGCPPLLQADRVEDDDGQVHNGERDEGTEVDHRRDELERELHGQQGHDADDEDGVRRGQELRVDVRQEPGDAAPAVAAHHVDHAGHAGMRREARGDHGGEGGRDEEDLEELAAHLQRHLGKRAFFGDLETLEGREHGLAEPRRDEEDRAADEQGEDDRLRDGARGLGLLAVHRDRIEPDEREAHHGGARHDGRHLDALVVQRVQREDRALAHAIPQREPRLDDERGYHHNLEHHEDPVDPRRPLHAQVIERGDRRDVHHDENPRRGLREERLEVGAADDRVHHRKQQIVEQRRPPDEEPEVRMDRLGRVGIRRSRRGVDARHPAVADRGEHHRDQRKEVGEGHHRVRLIRDDSERVEDRHGGHVSETQADDRPHPELSGQVRSGRMGNILRALRHGTHPPNDRYRLSPAAGAPAHVDEVRAAVVPPRNRAGWTDYYTSLHSVRPILTMLTRPFPRRRLRGTATTCSRTC